MTSISAAAAALGRPLVERDEVLTVLPGTLPRDELAAPPGRHRLRGRDEARPHVPQRPRRGRPTRGRSRASTSSAPRWTGSAPPPLADVDPASVPYFAIALLPGRGRRLAPDPPAAVRRPGEVVGRRARPGRSRLADPAGRGRPRRSRRPRRLRPLPGPRAAEPAPGPARQRQPRRGRARRARARPRRRRAPRRGRVVGRPGRVRHGRRGAGGRGPGRSTPTSRCACYPG